MAEIQDSAGQSVGGLAQAHPQEFQIRAQNAQRVARRRQAAALHAEIARTGTNELSRQGEQRQVGGTFETLQEVPDRIVPEAQGLQLSDLAAILQALSFGAQNQTLGSSSFLSSFGPGVTNVNN